MSGDGFGMAARGLSGGIVVLVTVITTFGAATGGVAFLMRNAPGQIKVSLALAAVAVLIAGLVTIWPWVDRKNSRVILLCGSAVLLGISLYLVVDTQTRLLAQPSRPDIAAEWAELGDARVLKISIKADALTRDDELYSTTVASTRDPATGATTRVTLHSGSTGPDPDGKGSQTQHVVVPGAIDGVRVESLQIAAVVLRREILDEGLRSATLPPSGTPSPGPGAPPQLRVLSVDCNGKLQVAEATGTQVRELAIDINALPACLNLGTLPQMAATPTPTPA
jgi:hypothetical protein